VNDTDENGTLPEGWATRTIGAVLDARYGKSLTAKKRNGGDTPVYGSNGVVGHHDVAITGAPVIVIGRKGSVGAVNYSAQAAWPIDTTYFIDDFRVFAPPFLRDLLRSLRLGEMDRSTAIPGLSREQLYERELVVPPLAEQKRIAQRLDDLEAHRVNAEARLNSARYILGRFHRAVLAAACSGRLTEDFRQDDEEGDAAGAPASWRRTILRDLTAGIRGGSSEVPIDSVTKYPVLRSSSVRPLTIDYDDVRYLSEEQSHKAANFIEDGDILVTRLNGNIEYVGNAAVVAGIGSRRFQYPDRLFRVTLKEPAHARYLELFFASPQAQAQVQARSRSAAGHQRISISDLKGLSIELPPLDEQHEIIRRTSVALDTADRLGARIERTGAALDLVAKASLAKAVRGELVPNEAVLAEEQGRDYESADELLDRIEGRAGHDEMQARRRVPASGGAGSRKAAADG
jgi:type I restriction enzyme S subunit